MALDRAALIKQISESTSSGGGNYIRDSRGILAVKKMFLQEGAAGAPPNFIAEFVVVSSMKIPVFALQDGDGHKKGQPLDIEPYPTGASCSVVNSLGNPREDPGFGKTRALILALYGFSPNDVTPAQIGEVLTEIDSTNAAYGWRVSYETRRVITKTNKIEIVVPDFSTFRGGSGAGGEQTDADVQQYRAWIESLYAAPAVTPQTQPAATA